MPGRSGRRSTCCCGCSRPGPARAGVFKRAGQIGRPCLLGYIGKCSAPCVGRVSADEHRADRRRLLRLHGRQDRPDDPAAREGRWPRPARNLEFELAARLRDDLEALRRAMEKQAVVLRRRHRRRRRRLRRGRPRGRRAGVPRPRRPGARPARLGRRQARRDVDRRPRRAVHHPVLRLRHADDRRRPAIPREVLVPVLPDDNGALSDGSASGAARGSTSGCRSAATRPCASSSSSSSPAAAQSWAIDADHRCPRVPPVAAVRRRRLRHVGWHGRGVRRGGDGAGHGRRHHRLGRDGAARIVLLGGVRRRHARRRGRAGACPDRPRRGAAAAGRWRWARRCADRPTSSRRWTWRAGTPRPGSRAGRCARPWAGGSATPPTSTARCRRCRRPRRRRWLRRMSPRATGASRSRSAATRMRTPSGWRRCATLPARGITLVADTNGGWSSRRSAAVRARRRRCRLRARAAVLVARGVH